MGNEISQPKQEGIHVEHQQRFFEEYKQMTLADIEIAKRDAARWDSVEGQILDMPLETQATFCDYVTEKTCALGEDVIKSAAESLLFQLKWLIENKRKMGTCAVGNAAKIIISLPDSEFKEELAQTFDQLLILQREIRDKPEPDLKEQMDNLNPTDPKFNEQVGKMFAGILGNAIEQMNQGKEPQDIGRALLTQLGGPPDLADEAILHLRATELLQEKVNSGMSLDAAIRATRAEMPVLPKAEIEIKIKVRFDEEDDDDVESA